MVLAILETVYHSRYFPSNYVLQIGVGLLVALTIRVFFQGKRTTWERDLHARTILLTGGFTPLGLPLLQSLAQRGAHLIVLAPTPIASSPQTTILIDLLRTTTNNEQIYAEHCDLNNPHSIRAFCTKFLTTNDQQRLDAIIFAHEYTHIGPIRLLARKCFTKAQRAKREEAEARQREAGSLASFLITTLLLPLLLVAPVERDIRIINIVNPFYAAAARPAFHEPNSSFPSTSASSTPKTKSTTVEEGTRSLRTVILTRHLQRILTALPSSSSQGSSQVPPTSSLSTSVPTVPQTLQNSNIVAVSVSPGISRLGTVAPLLNADWNLTSTAAGEGATWRGILLYLAFLPFLKIFTKDTDRALQSVYHALFLPTPFKGLGLSEVDDAAAGGGGGVDAKGKEKEGKEGGNVHVPAPPVRKPSEVLKPGALYAECAVVRLRVPVPTQEQVDASISTSSATSSTASKPKQTQKPKEKQKLKEVLQLDDDGEYGGEVAGRLVWEAYEDALKVWERSCPVPPPSPPSDPTTATPASTTSSASASEKTAGDTNTGKTAPKAGTAAAGKKPAAAPVAPPGTTTPFGPPVRTSAEQRLRDDPDADLYA
ncbi:hypothetical protein FA15DRAFT_692883 [Coprinopsis marcescibilis]|uniref:Ketoreductase (KR) domain-containing protein n=1 Tax=Coprinopsis marcescibilis TaxID=230819 RepID=A0A5C3L2T6_COPMA|nr:hypothetical protein FA15DRAFT_692883 [Coprinopsis marcescibilis]